MSDINVGKRIKDTREAQGISAKDFAEKVEITTKYLYEIEAGKRNFSTDILCRMAGHLKVSCDYIMFGKDDLESESMEMLLLLERMDKPQRISIQRILKILYEISEIFDKAKL